MQLNIWPHMSKSAGHADLALCDGKLEMKLLGRSDPVRESESYEKRKRPKEGNCGSIYSWKECTSGAQSKNGYHK